MRYWQGNFLLIFFLALNGEAAENAPAYAALTQDGNGAVASVNPIATQAGLEAFAKGGNAIDAAAAIAFTLGVVDSHNSGIGGGCFMIIRTADGEVLAIDGREMAPAKAHRDMFVRDGKVVPALSKTGALAVGIPGSVAALYYAQQKAGKLEFSDVILPAADVAKNGFPIDGIAAKRMAHTQSDLAQFEATTKVFLDANGEPHREGDILVQKDLAKTYRKLAKIGPDYFYRKGFPQAVERWMKKNDGLVRAADFSGYQLKHREPVITQFQGFDIIGFPPPSSGGAMVAEILNILDFFDLKALSEGDRYHIMIEAMKLAFADRAHWMGDADFVNVPKGLVRESYAKRLAAKISRQKARDVSKHGTPPGADSDFFGKHTTHIATADKAGNWVAITTTLNTSYGSKVMIPGTGVLMNNQMDDFSAQPGVPNAFGLVGAEANSVQPGKRPLSSMSPTLVLRDGEPVMTLGAAGGPTIITQVVQALVNRLALDKSLQESVAMTRVHQQWRPETVYIDSFADTSLREGLEAKGHSLKVWPPFGATQAISLDSHGFEVVTEPRLLNGYR